MPALMPEPFPRLDKLSLPSSGPAPISHAGLLCKPPPPTPLLPILESIPSRSIPAATLLRAAIPMSPPQVESIPPAVLLVVAPPVIGAQHDALERAAVAEAANEDKASVVLCIWPE
mmetsp:Transcript_30276/g.92537  ORF Transcript_30276/g.92537 Transcript_30276/m.92537 type:complete len:116 (-) Transcript_30276:399-746(-)